MTPEFLIFNSVMLGNKLENYMVDKCGKCVITTIRMSLRKIVQVFFPPSSKH